MDKSDVWKKYPARMLRHKAYIQAARMAFGISEVIDDDEARRMPEESVQERDITPEKPVIDIETVDDDMSDCKTLDELKTVSSRIRKDFEGMGIWNEYKSQIIDFNNKHKDRINGAGQDIEEAEFEEVVENLDDPISMSKANDDELDDVPFDTDDEF